MCSTRAGAAEMMRQASAAADEAACAATGDFDAKTGAAPRRGRHARQAFGGAEILPRKSACDGMDATVREIELCTE